jgi:hypothetical protein
VETLPDKEEVKGDEEDAEKREDGDIHAELEEINET